MSNSYKLLQKFKNKYPMTIAWRIKQHCTIVDKHLNPGEKILYIFAGQSNDSPMDLFHTGVVALTNKRIIVATKRVLFGYFFKSITPDMYNDLSVNRGIIWGRIDLDTVKEVITITNIGADALSEIETNITEIMMENKKEYAQLQRENKKVDKDN